MGDYVYPPPPPPLPEPKDETELTPTLPPADLDEWYLWQGYIREWVRAPSV